MEYLALSYPGETAIRLVEPRPLNVDLSDTSGRRGERAPPGDRLTLVYDEGEKRAVTEEVEELPVFKPLNAPKIYVLQSRMSRVRD